ncbi:unnamed protein product [Victoria cruziana]
MQVSLEKGEYSVLM